MLISFAGNLNMLYVNKSVNINNFDGLGFKRLFSSLAYNIPGIGLVSLKQKSLKLFFLKNTFFLNKYKNFRFLYLLPQYKQGFLYLNILRRNLFVAVLNPQYKIIYHTSVGFFLKQIGSGKAMTKLTLSYGAVALASKLVRLKISRFELLINSGSGRHRLVSYFLKRLLAAFPRYLRSSIYIPQAIVLSKLKFNGTRLSRLPRKRRTYRPRMRQYF
jgi:hypothetical protein